MAQANLGTLNIKVKTELDNATKAFEELDRRVKSADGSFKKINATVTLFEAKAKQAKETTKVLGEVALGSALAVAGLGKAFQMASEGARTLSAQAFFEKSAKDIQSYRAAVNGMVSDSNLMKKANLADSMGIDEKTFKKLAGVAQVAALKTGQSFEYMFDSIIVGTARASRLLLDNLGIIVSVEQANINYAKSIGVASDKVASFVKEMSDEQKQLAFVQEVVKKSNDTMREAAVVGETASVAFEKTAAKISNLVDKFQSLMAVIGEGVLGRTTNSFLDSLEQMFDAAIRDTRKFAQEMTSILSPVVIGMAGGAAVGSVGGGVGAAPGAIVGGFLGAGFSLMGNHVGSTTRDPFGSVTEAAISDLNLAIDNLNKTLRPNGPFSGEDRRISESGIGAILGQSDMATLQNIANLNDQELDNLQQLNPAYAEAVIQVRRLAKNLGRLPSALDEAVSPQDKTGKGGGGGGRKETYEQVTARADQLINRLNEEEQERIDRVKIEALKEQEKAALAYQRELDDLYRSITKATQDGEDKIAEAERIGELGLDAMNAVTQQQHQMAQIALGGVQALVESGFSEENIRKTFGDAIVSLGSAFDQLTGGILGAANAIVNGVLDWQRGIREAQKWGPGLNLEERNDPLQAFRNASRAEQEEMATGLSRKEIDDAWWANFFGFTLDQFNKEMEYAIKQYEKELQSNNGSALEDLKEAKRRALEEAGQRATEENTRALRDLVREFRNLPSGYKVERAIYDTTQPVERSDFQPRSAIDVQSAIRRWRPY